MTICTGDRVELTEAWAGFPAGAQGLVRTTGFDVLERRLVTGVEKRPGYGYWVVKFDIGGELTISELKKHLLRVIETRISPLVRRVVRLDAEDLVRKVAAAKAFRDAEPGCGERYSDAQRDLDDAIKACCEWAKERTK